MLAGLGIGQQATEYSIPAGGVHPTPPSPAPPAPELELDPDPEFEPDPELDPEPGPKLDPELEPLDPSTGLGPLDDPLGLPDPPDEVDGLPEDALPEDPDVFAGDPELEPVPKPGSGWDDEPQAATNVGVAASTIFVHHGRRIFGLCISTETTRAETRGTRIVQST